MTTPHNKSRLQVISTVLQLFLCTRNDATDPQDPSNNLIEIISSSIESRSIHFSIRELGSS